MYKNKYTISDWTNYEWIEEKVKKGVSSGGLKQYIAGIDNNYRILVRNSYFLELTDIHYLILGGLYPVYLKYGFDLDKRVRKNLEEMIDGGDPRELFQVYNYEIEEIGLRDDYSKLPFVVIDKELVYKLKKKILESEELLKKATVDGWPIWEMTKNMEIRGEFKDPEAFFCEEYMNGGRKGYVYVAREEDEEIQKRIEDSIAVGKFRNLLRGTEEEYRILSIVPQGKLLTDIMCVLEDGLYPLYLNGFHDVKNIIRKELEEMVNSADPIDLIQAYEYISSETYNIKLNCNLPFIVVDRELIYIAKKRRIELENLLKEIPVSIHTAWEITERIEKNYDAFNNTDEFCKEFL